MSTTQLVKVNKQSTVHVGNSPWWQKNCQKPVNMICNMIGWRTYDVPCGSRCNNRKNIEEVNYICWGTRDSTLYYTHCI